MTEQATGVPSVVQSEPEGPPVPKVQAGSPEAGSTGASLDADTIVERAVAKLKAEYDAEIDKRIVGKIDSLKDKRLPRLEERVESLYEWVERSGGDTNKIRGDVELQTLRQRLDALEGQPGAGGRGGSPATGNDERAAEILSKIRRISEVDFTPDEVASFWGKDKSYTSWEAAEEAAQKAAAKKLKGENIGVGAGVSGPGRSGATQTETDGEIADKLEAAMKKPTEKAGELKRLQEEAKKRGLLK